MKRTKIVMCISFICSCFLFHPAANADNYIKNRTPLAEVPYMPLPVGSVKAEGWLLKQLQLQKDGLTGYAESLYSGNDDLGAGSDWLGGGGNSWERAPYYTKGLVALAYVLNDATLKTKAQKWIDWSLDHQRSDGYFGPTAAGRGDWWMRMPMLYAIRDYYDATGDARVIPFFTKYFRYENNTIGSQLLSDWGKSRAGDNIEIVFWLYNRTGESFLLDLADKLKNQAYNWTDILTNNLFNQFGSDFQPKHNVNVPQAMKMPAIYWQKSHAEADRDAYVHGREHLLCDHGQPHGMQSGNEMLAGRSALTGLELCSVVEQMQTSETAQMILGDASIGDQLEQVAFNALPGGLANDIKGLQYYQQANQILSKFGYYHFGQNYDNGNMPGPYSGYGCCRFDFHMGWPYYVKTMWAATVDNGLAAMAYGPCTVTALVADSLEVTIRESTDYPFNEELEFQITLAQQAAFPLKFRVPGWCELPLIRVNSEEQTGVESGDFYTINRTWSDGDTVRISFPMPLRAQEEVNNSVSIHRGPLVFSLKITERRTVYDNHNYGNGFYEYEVSPTSTWNYALVIDRENPANSITIHENSEYNAATGNPFATPPYTLSVSARSLPSWNLSFNNLIATDPPFSPVETSERPQQVTLVPYGSETLRATCFPYVGVAGTPAASLSEDFSGGQKGWVQYGGSFYVKNGEYVATNREGGICSKSVYSAAAFSDFTYDAEVQVNSNGDAGLLFRAGRLSFGPDEYSGYYVGISSSGRKVELGKANGSWSSLMAASNVSINSNQWYRVQVVTKGTNIKVYVDDMTTPKIDYNDASFSSGYVGVRCYDSQARWRNILVTSSVATSVSVPRAGGEISLYPNPVTDDLSIEVPQTGRLSVYDFTGKQVYSADVAPGVTTLHTNGYETGIYFVKVVTNEGAFHTRFLKKMSLS
ncbi:MAG: glycoside hydrolase family 127 protein [Tannerella sp.]|jgi:hypothetical protein|nr:glycoside hydrolase family 127 protein [Tannerella sp.]